MTKPAITEKPSRENILRILAALEADEPIPPKAATALKAYIGQLQQVIAVIQNENANLRAGHYPRQGEAVELTVQAGEGSYTRLQPQIVREWVCEICGTRNSRVQLPGNTPKYCTNPGGKPSQCQREAARRRVAEHRARQQE